VFVLDSKSLKCPSTNPLLSGMTLDFVTNIKKPVVIINKQNIVSWYNDAFIKALSALGFEASNYTVDISSSLRAFRAALATGVGFVFANIFCWIFNRLFVFKPGRHHWFVELLLFFAVSLMALGVGLAVQTVLINFAGWTTSSAFILEIISSFVINYVVRKFFIFKG
jgi:putative flippase GtrA